MSSVLSPWDKIMLQHSVRICVNSRLFPVLERPRRLETHPDTFSRWRVLPLCVFWGSGCNVYRRMGSRKTDALIGYRSLKPAPSALLHVIVLLFWRAEIVPPTGSSSGADTRNIRQQQWRNRSDYMSLICFRTNFRWTSLKFVTVRWFRLKTLELHKLYVIVFFHSYKT